MIAASGHGERSALTLIELLTSVAIALALSVLATVAFLQVQRILLRTTVRLEMHNSARFMHQSLSEQCGALQQDAAMWLESKQDDGTGSGQVSLTFLKGKTDEHGYTTTNGSHIGGEEYGIYQNRCCDLEWSRWRWDQRQGALYAGASSPPREFRLTTSWAGPNGDYGRDAGGNYPGNVTFMQMPQPLRQAVPYPAAIPVGSSQAALSGNRYGSPDLTADASDYQDLTNQMAPVMRNVTRCVIELVLADGSVVDADTSQDRTLSFDGNFVDARVASLAGGAPSKRRPRLIRLLADMTDPVTKVTQSFSFSFQPPGMLPTIYPPGSAVP